MGDDGPPGRLTRTPAVRASRVGPTWSTGLALAVLRTDRADWLSEESISDCARLTGARRTSANADSDNRAARERTFIAFSFRGSRETAKDPRHSANLPSKMTHQQHSASTGDSR